VSRGAGSTSGCDGRPGDGRVASRQIRGAAAPLGPGRQYASEQFQRLLADHGITCSMSRSGDVWDNSAMESFFSSLKIERMNRRVYATRDEAKADVFDYVERLYNPRRRHSTLGYLSPVEYENAMGSAQDGVTGDRANPNRFVGDKDASPGQQVLDIPVAQVEAIVEPDGMLDDCRGKTGDACTRSLGVAFGQCRAMPVDLAVPPRQLNTFYSRTTA
jgi:hypothetical protein